MKVFIFFFPKFKIYGALKVSYQNMKELLKSQFVLQLNPALEHLPVNDYIIMRRHYLQRFRQHWERRYFFFSLSPVCVCMYTDLQQSRAIAFKEKYGAISQHPGIINIHTSTDIHYTRALWHRFITLSPCNYP